MDSFPNSFNQLPNSTRFKKKIIGGEKSSISVDR
jgi:hypothetical protein